MTHHFIWLIFLLAFSLLPQLQNYYDLETGNFTETGKVRCLSPLAKSVLLLHLKSDCQTTSFGFVKNCKSVFKLEHRHRSNLTDLWHDGIQQVGFSV